MRNLNVLYMETAQYDGLDPESFVTVFPGLIDPERGVMTYASAGHEAVFLQGLDTPLEVLISTGPPIGAFEDGHNLPKAILKSPCGAPKFKPRR